MRCPATNLRCRRIDDSSENFGPGASACPLTNTLGDNRQAKVGFSVSISRGAVPHACIRISLNNKKDKSDDKKHSNI
jgi:hypothetical protein